MKYFLASIIFLSSFAPALVLAYPGQYPWDPLYLQVSPTQQTKNEAKKQSLKSQYGTTAFYQCYNCVNKDTSDPSTENSCLLAAAYCLERNQIAGVDPKSPISGSAGDIPQSVIEQALGMFGDRVQKTQVETPDQVCRKNYGELSLYQGKNNDGQIICGCADGYEFNLNRTVCIQKKPTCPSGSFYENGSCKCAEGYELNSTKTACVQKQVTCPFGFLKDNGSCVDSDSVCKEDKGVGGYYTGNSSEREFMCGCSSGYEFNAAETFCIMKGAMTRNKPMQKPKAVVKKAMPVVKEVQKPKKEAVKKEEPKAEVKAEVVPVAQVAQKKKGLWGMLRGLFGK